MKKLLLILMLFATMSVNAQWQKISIVDGTNVNLMTKDSSGYLFAISQNDMIYRSSDNGNSWQNFTNGTFSSIQKIVSTSSSVIMSTYNGVFRTTNHGINWIPSNSGLSGSITNSLHVNGNYIFAGCDGKVFKSSNDGNNWTTGNQVLGMTVWAIGSSGNYLFAETSIGSRGKMYVSTNNGDYWDSVIIGAPGFRFFMSSIASSGNNVYVGGMATYRFYQTSNYGQNWTNVQGLPSSSNAEASSISAYGNIVVASYLHSYLNYQIYISTNYGSTFYPTASNLSSDGIKSCLVTNNGIFAYTTRGIYKSTNYGNNWYGSNNGYSNINFKNVLAVDSIVIAGSENLGVYISRNYGSTWNLISQFGNTASSYSYLYDANKIYLYNSSGFVYSTNEGNSWITIPYPPSSTTSGHYYAKDSVIIYSTQDGIYKTTNFGVNWIKSDNGVTSPFVLESAVFINESVMFAQIIDWSVNYLLFKSTNGGVNWTQIVNPYNNQNEIKFFTQNLNTIYAGTMSGLYASTNNGDSWTLKSNGMPISSVQGLTYVNNIIYAATSTQGIYKSTDNALTWQSYNDGISNNTIYSISSGGPVLFAGGSGSFYIRNPETSINHIGENIPSKYSLGQNYPNPFNSSSKFKFEISKSGDVKIIVYDIQGREVQTLVNERLSAGTYEVRFDGSMLTSGVYFYRMVTHGFTEAKRMLLIK